MKKFDRINKRRHELINKKFSEGLTASEARVFDRIQNYTMHAIEENMPDMRLDFRPIIEMKYFAKQVVQRLYPKGRKYPGSQGARRK